MENYGLNLTTIKYTNNNGKWVEVSRKVEPTTEEVRHNVFSSCSFFRNLGGTETNKRISTGGHFYKNISTSPDREHRTVRIFSY